MDYYDRMPAEWNSHKQESSSSSRMELDTYYISKLDFPKLEILRGYIRKGEVHTALNFFKQENLDPNAYIKGQRPGTWVPLLYQCFQDKRMSPLIKVLINRGGDPLLQPDGEDEKVVPLIYLCDDIYLDFLVKKGLTVFPATKTHNLYECFLYARFTRVHRLLQLNLLTGADLAAIEATYPDVHYTMLNTAIKFLTYYYGAQIKKIRQGGESSNLKKTTEDLLNRYVGLLGYLRAPPPQTALDLCAKYYLYEILQVYQAQAQAREQDPLQAVVSYGLSGTQEALLRPLLNDYRYEQTCLALAQVPDASIYLRYSSI